MDLRTAKLIDYTLRLNACIWALCAAMLVLVALQFPGKGAVQPIGLTVSMIGLSALTNFLWLGKLKARVNLQSKLLSGFFAQRMPRPGFIAACCRVVSLSALLVTAYVLTVSFGLFMAVSLQSEGAYCKGEEIYRAIPGYKSLCDDRPISLLWIGLKTPNLAKLELATKRVYGDESREVGFFYRACADNTDSRQDRQKYLNEALRRFRQENMDTDSTECMVILANRCEEFDKMPQAYAELYPRVLQHPSFFSCFYLEHMATYLKRPQKEIDRLKVAERAISERNAPQKLLSDGVFCLIFAIPLGVAMSVVAYRASLPFFSWFWTRQLGSSLSVKKKFEILNKLITVELLRGKLDRADKSCKQLFALVESC